MITLKKGDDGSRHFELGDVCLKQTIRTFREGFDLLQQSYERGQITDRHALVGLRQLRQERLELDREEMKSRFQSSCRRGRFVSLAETHGGFTFQCNGHPLESAENYSAQFKDVKSGVALAIRLSALHVFTAGERNQALAVLDLENKIQKFERLLRKSFEASREPSTAAGGS